MTFGNTPKDAAATPLGSVYVPGTSNSDLTALEGMAINTDGNSQKSSAARMGAKAGDIVDLATLLTLAGTSGDANTVASLMGRLTKIRDLLNATLTVAGTITEANSASIKTDLDSIVTNTTGAATAANQSTGNTSLASIKTDLDTLAAAISASIMQVSQKAAASTSATLQSAQSGNAAGSTLNVLGMSAAVWTVNMSGFTGTVNFEGSEDGTNFSGLSTTQLGTTTISTTTTGSTTTAITIFECSVGGLQLIRARTSGVSAGTVTVTAHAVPINFAPRNVNANQAGTWTEANSGSINTGVTQLHTDLETTGVLQGASAAAGTAWRVKGDFAEQASLSAGSLNADLVPSTDVSNYKWLSLQINTSAYSGTLSFQASNDNTNWTSLTVFDPTSSGSFQTTTSSTNIVYVAPLFTHYLRIRMTSYTSGTAQGTLELYTTSSFQMAPKVSAAQNGTWTVQPGNTANTTPWLASDHDGTNKAQNLAATSVSNAIGSQAARLVAGAYAEQASLSAGSLNADLVPSTDVSNYKWWSLHIGTSSYSGSLTFQGSNDNVNFIAINGYGTGLANQGSGSSSTNQITSGPVYFRYLRVRMTSYTSGTAQGTLELYTSAPAFALVQNAVTQSGTWTVQPGNTANTTPWLESVHDGTNKANVLAATSVSNALASQGALLTAGADMEVSFTTTTAQAVASTDVTNYRWVSVQITSQGTSSSVTFQGCNDNSTWISIPLQPPNTTGSSTATSTAATGIWHGPLPFRYFRLNVTGISAGTTAGVIEFHTFPLSMLTMQVTEASTTWATQTPPSSVVTAVASAAYTTTQTQVDQTNSTGKGIKVFLNVTSAGTGSITLEVDGKDGLSATYFSILTGAAVTSNGFTVYTIYPTIPAVANSIAQDVLSTTFRVKVVANNANSMTYSVSYNVIQ